MEILVLGNGFDLAHDLPTKYADFLMFIRAFTDYHAGRQCKEEYQQFFTAIKGTPVYDEIVEHISTNNRLLKYFLDIYEERCGRGKTGWIDFESEISNIVKRLEVAKQIVLQENEKANPNVHLPFRVQEIANAVLLEQKNGTGEFGYFPEGFEEGNVNALVDGLKRLTRLLEIYLSEYIDRIEIKKRLPECKEKYTHVISFNYTNTYQKLYDPSESSIYCYVHGEARKDSSKDQCNMVLGIDEYLPLGARDSNNSFEWFKKFYQRIYKGTDTNYVDWINGFLDYYERLKMTAKPPCNAIHIYGHSLDVTDKDVLSSLILLPNTVTNIYYYDNNDYSKKIINLIKIIGEENLIKRTQGSKRTIVFVQTQAPEQL